MTEKKTNRGGAGRGQGRKPVSPGEPTVATSIRLTEGQREKLALLGGPAWVRGQIDAAVRVSASGVSSWTDDFGCLHVKPPKGSV